MGLMLPATVATHAHAQRLHTLKASRGQPSTAAAVCGITIQAPKALPPMTSGPVVWQIAPCFPGMKSKISVEVYLRDIHLRVSRPSLGAWIPFDAFAETTILEDFQRLWNNYALAELSVDVQDYRFSNGVIGKIVTYNITE
jgi:hypothetical protein